MQKAGRHPAPARMIVQVSLATGRSTGRSPRPAQRSRAGEPALAADQLQVNLQDDIEAACIASADARGSGERDQTALDNAGKGIDEEGRNLIGDKAGP